MLALALVVVPLLVVPAVTPAAAPRVAIVDVGIGPSVTGDEAALGRILARLAPPDSPLVARRYASVDEREALLASDVLELLTAAKAEIAVFYWTVPGSVRFEALDFDGHVLARALAGPREVDDAAAQVLRDAMAEFARAHPASPQPPAGAARLLVSSTGRPREVLLHRLLPAPVAMPAAPGEASADVTCTTPCDLALAPGPLLLRTQAGWSASTEDRLDLLPPGLSVKVNARQLGYRRAAKATAIAGAVVLVGGLVTVAVAVYYAPPSQQVQQATLDPASPDGGTPTGVYVGGGVAAAGLLAIPVAVILWAAGRDAVVAEPLR